MPNIALTTYCNLHCPYCFADTMIKTEDIKNITLEQFKKTLDWIGDANDKIGLIGGEPTLHPQFMEILQIINEYNKTAIGEPHFVLFTNGIYLDKYIQYLPNNMDILINVNQPEAMTVDQHNRLINNINILYKLRWLNTINGSGKVTIGCNICEQIDNYDFIWNITKKFNIQEIRFSVTAPTLKNQLLNKDLYYNNMKSKFIDFVADAIENNVRLNPDCNQIPPCYFDEEELRMISEVAVDGFIDYPKCEPVIDITPDFKASNCFGAYGLINCEDFNNLQEIERYMLFKIMCPKILANNSGKCSECDKFKKMQCQGGCLAFSNYKHLA